MTRAWAFAAAGSIVFHVGLVVTASMLPDGPRSGGTNDKLFTPGAVIPIEALPLARAEPIRRPRLPSATDPDSPASAPSERDRATSTDAGGSSEPPPDPTDAREQMTPGLSLHGLRDSSRASTSGSVIVDPALLSGSRETYEEGVANPGVGDGAVQGPAPPPATDAEFSFKREKGKLMYRDPGGRFVATLRSDGRVDFRNKGAKATWQQIGIGDPGALLSAAAGEDPYARAKAKLLKATFELRLGMAVKFQKRQIDKRLRRLVSDLDKIWADERRALADRKELVFQRWDECDEPEEVASAEIPGFGTIESSELDDARHDAAASARTQIEKFVREHAPKGSPEQFTASELADMNRRRVSKQKFAPY